ncbi:MAG: penicillin acylase family protein [Micromonosporaceae bacterium]
MKRPLVLKIALSTVAVVVALALAAVIGGVWAVRHSFPQHGGTLRLPGLSAPVTVHRDLHGIPNLYARTETDLFRAQGYVHAQDRFWEMDFRRHVTGGRLAELFGESQVATDAYLRTMGWRRVAEQEWQLIGDEARRFLTAYAEGVNAWLAEHDGAAASLEYALLGLQNPGYEIEPWSPVDSLAWLKAMAWDLRGNMQTEITRAALRAHGLSDAQIDELYPAYPYERNLPIVTDGRVVDGGFDPAASAPATPPTTPTAGALPLAALDRLADGLARIPVTVGAGEGIGSNSWVVSGAYTVSGKPVLANDPHLAPSMPGIWYQMGLHCACGYEVTGFTFSGLPGVVIGHNGRIAWGFTNLGPDVTDLYLERVRGDEYEVDGEWLPLERREETIEVAGGDPVTITVRASRHGPLISDASDELRDLAGEHAVALRWTALDPGRTVEAVFAVNRATNFAEFRAAAALFEVPAQNMVYADVDGNIGYQSPGRIPIRGKGDGRDMSPGWDSAYDWTGFIPFEELPWVYNPPRGYIVTANQAVIGPQYQHLLTTEWAYGARSQRIYDLIDEAIAARGRLDVADMQRMQMDNRNPLAPVLIPALLAVPLDGLAARAQDLLRDWDHQQADDSAPAAYFNAVWRHLLSRTFDELPADYRPDGGDRWFEVVRGLLADPASPWWDATDTPEVETAREIIAAALIDAAEELRARQGDNPARWRWGRMHTLTVEHQSFGTSGIGPIEWLFNHGPAPISGGSAIVNANGWNAGAGYRVTYVPSMRMIVDMADLDASRWIQLTGNSGHAFHPNYHDQFELWRTGETLPMRWQRESIEKAATDTLTLRP